VEWRPLEDARGGWGLVSNNVAGFAIAIARLATAGERSCGQHREGSEGNRISCAGTVGTTSKRSTSR